MPIYAYRCDDCDFSQDILQKISDPVLTVCPSCGKSEFKKQVTAAGFQLKGSGWYATDFKNSGSAPSSSKPADDAKTESTSSASEASAESKTSSTDSAKTQSTGSTEAKPNASKE